MNSRHLFISSALAAALSVTLGAGAPAAQAARGPLAIASATVTITGTTNVHGYTASTPTVMITKSQVAAGFDGDLWTLTQRPTLLQAFEIAIPVATLKSPKEGIDKNMHKALKLTEFKDITFRMRALEPGLAAGSLRAPGTLTIAGVSRDVVLELKAQRSGSNLSVAGEIPLLMTDFGVTPPKAMMGMMRTDPKITVRIELVLAPSAS